jgi:argininosuccinate synthase
MERIVLAYSGGLETSVAIPWLRDTRGADVITVTMDLGQGQPLEEVRDRALAAGAVRAHVLDLREELARDYIVPALKAGALHADRCPPGAALGRPLMAHALLNIAGIEQATIVAHGGTGRGPGRLEIAIRALNPARRVLAPARDWALTRAAAIDYARQRHIPVPAAEASPFEIDGSLWGRSINGGVLDDPGIEPPEEIYTITKPAADWPSEPAYVEITFERGVPSAVNGIAMSLLDIVSSLATIAGAHGVGRIDTIEHRPDGSTSRTIHEAPAAVVLHTAHAALQTLVTPDALERFSRGVSQQYSDVVCAGVWYSPLREALDAFVSRVQERVTGVVRLKLFNSVCRIVGRTSPHALGDRPASTSAQPVVVGG